MENNVKVSVCVQKNSHVILLFKIKRGVKMDEKIIFSEDSVKNKDYSDLILLTIIINLLLKTTSKKDNERKKELINYVNQQNELFESVNYFEDTEDINILNDVFNPIKSMIKENNELLNNW